MRGWPSHARPAAADRKPDPESDPKQLPPAWTLSPASARASGERSQPLFWRQESRFRKVDPWQWPQSGPKAARKARPALSQRRAQVSQTKPESVQPWRPADCLPSRWQPDLSIASRSAPQPSQLRQLQLRQLRLRQLRRSAGPDRRPGSRAVSAHRQQQRHHGWPMPATELQPATYLPRPEVENQLPVAPAERQERHPSPGRQRLARPSRWTGRASQPEQPQIHRN